MCCVGATSPLISSSATSLPTYYNAMAEAEVPSFGGKTASDLPNVLIMYPKFLISRMWICTYVGDNCLPITSTSSALWQSQSNATGGRRFCYTFFKPMYQRPCLITANLKPVCWIRPFYYKLVPPNPPVRTDSCVIKQTQRYAQMSKLWIIYICVGDRHPLITEASSLPTQYNTMEAADSHGGKAKPGINAPHPGWRNVDNVMLL